MLTIPGWEWVSCSRDVSWKVGEYRHLSRTPVPRPLSPQASARALTVLCGSTASSPDVWRRNNTKPDCPACLAEARKKKLIPKETTVADKPTTQRVTVHLSYEFDEPRTPEQLDTLVKEVAQGAFNQTTLLEVGSPYWTRGEDDNVQAEDASPEGRVLALPGWPRVEGVTMPHDVHARAMELLQGISVREYRDMLSRIEDRFRSNAAEKDELIFFKEFAHQALRGLD